MNCKTIICMVLLMAVTACGDLDGKDGSLGALNTPGPPGPADTPDPADTSAPTVPEGLSAIAVSQSQVDLTWTASTDDVGVHEYHIYRDSILINTVTDVAASDTGLSAGVQYCYQISSVDEAANESAWCQQACVSTQPPPNSAPVAKAGPDVYAEVGKLVPFDGSASEDADGDSLSFQWELIELPAGSQAVLDDPQTATPSLSIDAEGIYTVQLIVNDGKVDSAADTVSVATPEMRPDETIDTVVIGTDGIAYLLSRANQRIYRWSLAQQFPLPPIDLGEAPHFMAYSPSNGRLYLGYDSGSITRIDLDGNLQEAPFATTPDSLQGLAGAGDYLFAADSSGEWHTLHTFSAAGSPIDNLTLDHHSREHVWDPVNHRIYYFKVDQPPSSLAFAQIDPASGIFTDSGEILLKIDDDVRPPIRISPDGELVLLGSGKIFTIDPVGLAESLPNSLVDGAWMDTGLLTLRTGDDGRTLLEQWAADWTLANEQSFDGAPLRVFRWQDGYGVITLVEGKPTFHAYVPTNDRDGDGVPNDQDAFPEDPAASVDTDGDGYPDDWNPGYGPDDSTTGLELDAFPTDSACQLPSHGLPSNPDICDISSKIPAYTPDTIAIADDGVVYLLSRANDRIFRWSMALDAHMNPIEVGEAAHYMAYAPSAGGVYLGYESGVIAQIDPEGDLRETPFAKTPESLHGLAGAGDYLLAADASGEWHTHHIYAADGTLVASVELDRYSREYDWDPVNHRIYFFKVSKSMAVVGFEQIDPATGHITDSGETHYNCSNIFTSPIRVSPDGKLVLLGSGHVLVAERMDWEEVLPIHLVDAAWMDTGLLTVRTSDSGNTVLEKWTADDDGWTLAHEQHFDGEPLRVFKWQDGYAVITQFEGQPAFHVYLPN